VKKFLILTYGFVPPTPDVQREWGDWFAAVGPAMVDPGNPFGHGSS
jgi:hypothetical protein